MANKLYIGNSVLVDLSNYYNKSEVDSAISNVDVSDQLSNYVEKESGKVLSDNNFTDALKTKLEGLSNFDPTNINSAISAIQSTLGDITGDGAAVTSALDTWNEIKAFVSDYTNANDLQDLINTTTTNIQTWVGQQGFLTSTAAASTYQPKIGGSPVYQYVRDVQEDGTELLPGGTNLTPYNWTPDPSDGNGVENMTGAATAGYGHRMDTYFTFRTGLATDQNDYDGPDSWGSEHNILFAVGNGIHPILDELELPVADPNYTTSGEFGYSHDAFEIRESGDIYISNTAGSGAFYQKPMVHLQTAVAKANASIQNTGGVTAIVKLTQSAFNALASKDSGTLYIVEDDPVQAGS